MKLKLGLLNNEKTDETLILELLNIMERYSADYTNTFRELSIKKGVMQGTEYRLEADYEYGYKEAISKGYILNPVLKYLDAKETKHENEF